jgi:hypothetical protein
LAKNSKEPLSSQQQAQILTLLSQGESKREVAKIMGIGATTVRRYADRLATDVMIAASDPADPHVQLARRYASVVAENRKLRSQASKVNERGFGFDEFIDALKEVAEKERKNPLIYHPSKFASLKSKTPALPIDKNHAEIACLALSDWHMAETVRLRDANKINVYNSIVGANRLYDIVQRFKQIFTIHRAAYKFKSIWIPLLGDMVSGSIHPEFLVTNDMSDQNSVLLTSRMLKYAILELKQLGIPIQLDAVVGNHPRTTVKVPTKRIADSNFDYQTYAFTKMLFEGDDQVTFNVHTSQIEPVYLFDHRYVIEHGIEWKNGKEEESESRIRSLFDDPVYRKATGHKGAAFDQIVIGNLHKGAFLERTIKNPSLIGQNELGQQWRLAPIRAGQMMWGVSRNHARTFQYELDATDMRSSKPLNPFSEFACEFVKQHGVTFDY